MDMQTEPPLRANFCETKHLTTSLAYGHADRTTATSQLLRNSQPVGHLRLVCGLRNCQGKTVIFKGTVSRDKPPAMY